MRQMPLFSILRRRREPGAAKSSVFFRRGMSITLLRRPRQKSLRLWIEADGSARISCSLRASKKEIEAFVDSHWRWLQSRVAERERLRKKYPPKKFRAGEGFLFCGKTLKLDFQRLGGGVLGEAALGEGWVAAGRGQPEQSAGSADEEHRFCARGGLLVYYWRRPEDLHREVLRARMLDFYRREGEGRLREALEGCGRRMRLAPKAVRISAQKSLWGSCSDSGRISLNWRLIAAPPETLEYVVIHELAHLRHLNHSPAFWNLVSRFCPGFEKHEQWLKKNSHAMDFLLPASSLS